MAPRKRPAAKCFAIEDAGGVVAVAEEGGSEVVDLEASSSKPDAVDKDAEMVIVPKPSRAQRYIFSKYFHTLDEELKQEYQRIQKSHEKHKQNQLNNIINATTKPDSDYKSGLSVSTNKVNKILECSKTRYEDKRSDGVTWSELKGILHGEAGARDGLACGDVSKGDDGMYYLKRSSRGEVTQVKDSSSAQRTFEVDDKAFTKECINMELEFDLSWAKVADDPQPRSSLADDSLMRNLQEAFDATTRLTLATKRLIQDLASWANTDTTQQMATRGVQMCKALVPPSEQIETLLSTPRAHILSSDVTSALKAAAAPFSDLQMFHSELQQVHRLHCKKMRK